MLSKSIQQKGKRAEKEVANRIERAGLGKALFRGKIYE